MFLSHAVMSLLPIKKAAETTSFAAWLHEYFKVSNGFGGLTCFPLSWSSGYESDLPQ